MKKFILSLIFILSVQIQANSQTYSHAIELGDLNGYRYFISKEKFKFWDAHNHIKSIDSTLDLLSIHNVGESMFVYDKVGQKVGMSPQPPFYWLGGHDENQEGVWEWTDGSDWDYEQWTTDTTEANYGAEPNNLGGNENYLMVYYYSNGGWNDATNNPGDLPFYYVFKSAITTSQDTTNFSQPQVLENKVFPTLMNSEYSKIMFVTYWKNPITVVISDSGGKLLHKEMINNPKEVNTINLPYLPGGLYHGVAIHEKELFRFKFTCTK